MNKRNYSGYQRIGALGVALVMAFAFTGCGGAVAANADAAEKETPVEVQRIAKTSIKNELAYIGQVQPQKQVAVASRLAAEVKEVFFDIGDTVEEGDVLFTVDAKDITDQIRALKASAGQTKVAVDQASFGLQVAKEGSKQERLTELQYEGGITKSRYDLRGAELEKKSLKDAREDVDNMEDLARSVLRAEQAYLQELQLGFSENRPVGGLPVTPERINAQRAEVGIAASNLNKAEAAYDEIDTKYDASRIKVDGSRDGLSLARENMDAYDAASAQGKTRSIQQAQHGLESAQAAANVTGVQLSIAQESLGYAQVKSPISGIISQRAIESGQMISPQLLPFVVIAMETVHVQVDVSETVINSIFPGDQVTVEIQALGGKARTGVVTAVSPAAGMNSTYPIRVELDNADGMIKPGMFAQVSFVKDESSNTIVVDKNVVLSDESSSFVYVIRDGAAKRVEVTTGVSNGTTTEILTGLAVGDEVVVVGQEYLYDGNKVNVVKVDGESVQP